VVHARVRRHLAAVAAGLVVAGGSMLTAAPAGAVVDGTADTARQYPFVGTLVLALPDGSRRAWCTGTLVDLAPGAAVREGLVTTGSCLQRTVRQAAFPGSRLLGLTVAPKVSRLPGQRTYRGTALVHPGYPGRNRRYDLGVYLLPSGVTPVRDVTRLPRLPYVGQLDALRARGRLIGAPTTIVGYGARRAPSVSSAFGAADVPTAASTVVPRGGRRAFGSGLVSGISPLRLSLGALYTPRADGPCTGDAGAPRLLLTRPGSPERYLLVAVTGAAPTRCPTKVGALRLDRAEVLAWLATVPALAATR
jgi:hypothetical protein